MLTPDTLSQIRLNHNPGIEYEIALFYVLLPDPAEKAQVSAAFSSRNNGRQIEAIIRRTSTDSILSELAGRGLSLCDCSFETQNDDVGPADIVMYLRDASLAETRIGLSVKYANTCVLNITGRKFLTEAQITSLKSQQEIFTQCYIQEMQNRYGQAVNWFRKRKPSASTEAYIDLIREAVIENWPHCAEKQALLHSLYQTDSPIAYWIYKYTNNSAILNTQPFRIQDRDIPAVSVSRYETSYVAFFLQGRRIGHLQVKFNNGFLERCKKHTPDLVVEGIPMSFGQPFSSWNFNLEE